MEIALIVTAGLILIVGMINNIRDAAKSSKMYKIQPIISHIENWLEKIDCYAPEIYVLECKKRLQLTDLDKVEFNKARDEVHIATSLYTLNYSLIDDYIRGIDLIICKRSAYNNLLKYYTLKELEDYIIIIVGTKTIEFRSINKFFYKGYIYKNSSYGFEDTTLYKFLKEAEINSLLYAMPNRDDVLVHGPGTPTYSQLNSIMGNWLTTLILSLTDKDTVYEYIYHKDEDYYGI